MATPPLVGDLPMELLTGMVEGNTVVDDDDVIEARRWFMIKISLRS